MGTGQLHDRADLRELAADLVPDPRARVMDDGLALALVPSGETERTLAATASRMGSASAPHECLSTRAAPVETPVP